MTQTAKIKIMLNNGATMPTRATTDSVGYDVRATYVTPCEYIEYPARVENKEWYTSLFSKLKHYMAVVCFPRIYVCHTGIHLKPEEGYYVELLPNSRWGKRGVITYSPGQIDPDYTGEIIAIFKTLPWWLDWGKISAGDVIGQLIVRHKIDADFERVNKLDETERGEGGFGSTEKKGERP